MSESANGNAITQIQTFQRSELSQTRPRGMTQLLDLQDICYQRAMTAKVTNKDFSTLALAFTRLEEAIRIRRGIPLPGQLRPDLDPVQVKRMLKRHRARQVIDVDNAGNRSGGAATLDDDEQPSSSTIPPSPEGEPISQAAEQEAADRTPAAARPRKPGKTTKPSAPAEGQTT